jgi:hypothetical protein
MRRATLHLLEQKRKLRKNNAYKTVTDGLNSDETFEKLGKLLRRFNKITLSCRQIIKKILNYQ